MKKIAVYSAIFGARDRFKERPEGNFDSFLFTDKPVESSRSTVKVIELPVKGDPIRSSRLIKVMPHRFLKDHEVTLWLDGTMEIVADDLAEMLERHLAKAAIVTNRHPKRSCVYEEAAVCARQRNDVPQTIWEQVNRYGAMGYPRDNGLAETSVILRRNKAPEVVAFNEAWWSEIEQFSRRDQLSFDFTAWRLGIQYGVFEQAGFKWHPHGG